MERERRKHQRFKVQWRGRILLQDKKIHEVAIIGASRGGVSVIHSQAIPLGVAVNLEFFVDYRGENKRIRAKTIAHHNDILSAGRGASVGLEFKEITSDDMHALANALHAVGEENME